MHDLTPYQRREYKDNLRQHICYLEKYGPVEHTHARNFDSVWGMKSHIRGLIDFAKMVEADYAEGLLARFKAIDWPV
jgi:RNA-directed DNA polymerase